MVDASAAVRDRFQPSFPPVEAKLHPPIPRPGTVTRTRLLRLLDAESGPAVVSVVAPPGYGKTVLLAQWAALQERPVAWLTIDDLDNDPAVFLSYVALAMDRVEPIDPSIRGAMATPGPRILATAVPRLASELYRWSRPGLLILDDAHRLVDRICLDALAELLGHLPAGFQVALAARMTPNLPFARYRAHGQLLEIGPSRLALDQRETGARPPRAGHRLTPPEGRTLAERTEGWAAGIYLATLGLERGAGRVQSLDVVSGRDDFIAEYLQAELMRGLDEEDVAFLARTSILETVHPDIAEAVTGLPRGAERLRTLARANRLVSEADAHGTTYRYHHLMREYLQGELERREPALLPELHRRAWSWYLAAGQVERAVEHAMASGDDDAAARLVTAVALPTFYGGKVGTLDRWLRAFDGAVLERHPPLAVIAGWIHLLAGRAELADAMLDIAEHSTFEGPPADGSASLESSRAMLRAVMGRGGADDILANARLAAQAEAPGSPWLANARWLLGSALLLKGDTAAADAALAQASEVAAASGATAMVAMTKRASLALAKGDLAAAEHHAAAGRTILEQANLGEILAALLVHATSARIAIQLGHRTSALEQLALAQMVRPLASRAAPWFSVDALLELARAFLALSDLAGARGALRDATDIARHSRDLGVLNGELADLRQRLGEASSTLAGSSSLTAAELRLLPILSTYLSFQEIAERMHLSRNTVKTQALSIYGKLQASSRSEAVERAVELGLLEPFPGLRLTRRTGAD